MIYRENQTTPYWNWLSFHLKLIYYLKQSKKKNTMNIIKHLKRNFSVICCEFLNSLWKWGVKLKGFYLDVCAFGWHLQMSTSNIDQTIYTDALCTFVMALQTMLYLTCNWGVINHNNSNNAYINNIIPSEQQQFCSAIEYRRTTISIYVNYVLHVCMKVCMIEAIDRVVFVRTHISFPLASVL